MINWLKSNDFIEILPNKTDEPLILVDFCELQIKSEELIKFIPLEPYSEEEEFTEPGPCLKWFGIAQKTFLQITSYLHSKEFAIISVLLPKNKTPEWKLLEIFNFPESFIKSLVWLQGYKDSEKSVFTYDENDLIMELYRAFNETDGEKLCLFLRNNGFEKTLFIDHSYDLSIDWIIQKNDKFIGKYNSRYFAESFALRKSKFDDSVFTVYSPDKPNIPKINFVKGKKK